ncbi:MAG: hypothetical protein WCI67_22320 [Chloroflexales bacterium]
MTTTMRLLPVRVSADLRGLIDQVGPVNPGTRALLLLGADAAGLDLGGLEREIAGLLAADLDARVQAGLRQIFARLTARPPQVAAQPVWPTPEPEGGAADRPAEAEASGDPFAHIGINV